MGGFAGFGDFVGQQLHCRPAIAIAGYYTFSVLFDLREVKCI